MRLLRGRRTVAAALFAFVALAAGCSSSKKASSPTSAAPTTEASSGSTTTTKPAATPGGITLVAAPPQGVDPANWGDQTQIAVTKSGDPVVVFSHQGGDSDSEGTNGQLLVSRYDSSSKSWSKPEQIAKGYFPENEATSFALAVDPQSGALALVVNRQSKKDEGTGVDLYWSSDGGKSWTKSSVADGKDTVQSPRVAIDGGTVAVVYAADDGTHLATGKASGAAAPAQFTDTVAPHGDSSDALTNDWGPAVSLDSSGKPLVVFYVKASSGDEVDLVAWNGSGTNLATIASSSNSPTHAFSAITRSGSTVLVATTMSTSGKDDAPTVTTVASSDGGATWAKPAGTPNDNTSDPFDVSAALLGDHSAIVTYFPNGSGGGQKCAYPEAPWSANLTSWNACSLAEDDTHPSGGTNHYPAVAAGADGTYWIVYSVSGPTDKVPAGVFVRNGSLKDLQSAGSTDTGGLASGGPSSGGVKG